ncbi:MAG: 5'/3'-nucleotidase SurE [Kiritimatiellae bacterium]|nr:5'/3'-nucleotidase SurE [Kiritimatiellia bacterium]
MKILLCNDDGIQSEGLQRLADAVTDLGELVVVAPDGERSATGLAITLTRPLMARPWHRPGECVPFGTALDGTPADCVKFGINRCVQGPVDLVLSGLNRGPNAGISVLYSGTVAVATEAAIMGIPSIAFSVAAFENLQWDTGAAVARAVVRRYQAWYAAGGRMPRDVCWNVNIPNRPLAALRGLKVVPMGASRFRETYEQRLTPWGSPYYWSHGELEERDVSASTDLRALRDGYVALTPLVLDRTARDLTEAASAMTGVEANWTSPDA